MTFLEEIKNILEDSLAIPVETGSFSTAPSYDIYAVITPLNDTFDVFCDNIPRVNIHEARISLFTKLNYTTTIERIVSLFLEADFTITERLYVDHEDDTGYHHFAIDVAKEYSFMEDDA